MSVHIMSVEALLLGEASVTGVAPVLLGVSMRRDTTWWWGKCYCGCELTPLTLQSKVQWYCLVMGRVGVEGTIVEFGR